MLLDSWNRCHKIEPSIIRQQMFQTFFRKSDIFQIIGWVLEYAVKHPRVNLLLRPDMFHQIFARFCQKTAPTCKVLSEKCVNLQNSGRITHQLVRFRQITPGLSGSIMVYILCVDAAAVLALLAAPRAPFFLAPFDLFLSAGSRSCLK